MRCNSSPVPGVGTRCERFCTLMVRATLVISSTGRSARELSQYPPNVASASTPGIIHSSSPRKSASTAPVSSSGYAATAVNSSPAARTARLAVR